MCGRWLVIAVLAACGQGGAHGTTAPDAAPPVSTVMTYRLTIVPAEPPDRPPAPSPLTAYIDGQPAQELELTFPDEAAALGTSHLAELRYGDVVVASYSVTLTAIEGGCLGPPSDGIVTDYEDGVCAFDSGDLRIGGDSSTTTTPTGIRACNGDSFCHASCNCAAGQHCTERVASMSPFFSHLGCAPTGTKLAGDACTFTPDPAGAYDDCGDGLACVAGSCQPTCNPQMPCATGICGYEPGYPPEIMICQ